LTFLLNQGEAIVVRFL